MAVNIAGIIAVVIFYLVILAIGLWAARRGKAKEAEAEGITESEQVILAGRDIGVFIGILTMTGATATRIEPEWFRDAYSRFGLTSNTGKTKILAQGVPGQPPPDTSNVRLHGEVLETVEAFQYLGSYLSSDCTMQKDIDNRICAAHAAFGRIAKRVFLNHDLSLQTKIMVFQAIVLSTLLYGSELIETTVARHRLRWAGHVRRMPTTRLPRQILFSQLESGTRPRGAPKHPREDRTAWRSTVAQGTTHMETQRRTTAEAKRRKRQERLLLATATYSDLHKADQPPKTSTPPEQLRMRLHEPRCSDPS
ncbi:hypothetical protein Bbelb_180070 [Branchiostoma belcheri]|nr:hypothetical protein Bbelb_180070 [Branchiostoma belcheri]